MGHQKNKPREISLGDDFGEVTVKVNGISVDIHADGSIESHANDNPRGRRPAPRQVGDKVLDGAIYAGISPDTKQPMYAMPPGAPLTMTFNEAADYAKKLNGEKYLGHDDWRVPSTDELNVLFNNRAKIGGFNVSGYFPAGWYWSSSSYSTWTARRQRFSDGYQGYDGKDNCSSVRLVR